MNSHQKTAIITGAGGGIGQAIAQRLAADGYNLLLTDANENSLQDTAASIKNGPKIILYPGDLTDPALPVLLTQKAQDTFGRIDLLVNNAAWRTIETLRTISLDNWSKTIQVCLTAPAFLAREVASCMERNNTGGVIIHISSMMADRPAGYSPAYIAAKCALEGLTREMAATYGRSRIRVIGVKPGYIDTDLSKNYRNAADASDQTDQLADYVAAATPLASPAAPDAIANAVCWLGSAEAFFITGTQLTIDGGFTGNMNSYSIKHRLFPNEF